MAQLIYLADDEEALLEVFGTFLQSAGYDVQMFPTGDELFAAFQEHPSDLVILDIMMPGTDGLTICKKLRKFSDVPIIILTAKDSEMDYLHGLAIGGDDYLIKPFSPAMLVMRVKALLRRVDMGQAKPKEDEESNKTLSFADITMNEGVHEAKVDGRELNLTMTEFALLKCLLEGKGQAVSRDSLLKDVWGFQAEVETRVTDECVRRIRKKLKSAGSTVNIKAVWGFGYRLEDTAANNE